MKGPEEQKDGNDGENKRSPVCSNMSSPAVALVRCNFNHRMALATSADRSALRETNTPTSDLRRRRRGSCRGRRCCRRVFRPQPRQKATQRKGETGEGGGRSNAGTEAGIRFVSDGRDGRRRPASPSLSQDNRLHKSIVAWGGGGIVEAGGPSLCVRQPDETPFITLETTQRCAYVNLH